MSTVAVAEFLGDGIGSELREAIHSVAGALPIDIEFRPVDLSLESRETRGSVAYDEAIRVAGETRLALKYPTITKTESPNAILRRRLDFSVIHRPVISIEGVSSNFKESVMLHIVRVATGGTYEDPGQPIGSDAAVSLRIVEGRPCREAARFAFELASKKELSVTSSSKHTIQRVTDGLFEKAVTDVHEQYPDVPHHTELFDALLAKIILDPSSFQVVLCLNEYGDFLSDMACGLIGSLGTGASGSYAFDADGSVKTAMFDPAGGTAPDIAGQNVCNPAASLLAFGLLLDHIDRYDLGHALRLAMLGAIADGQCTRDLGGSLGTTEFTATVLDRLELRLP